MEDDLESGTSPHEISNTRQLSPTIQSPPIYLQFPISVTEQVHKIENNNDGHNSSGSDEEAPSQSQSSHSSNSYHESCDCLSSSSPASGSTFGRSIRKGPRFQDAPVEHGQLLREIYWDFLHSGPFSPGPLDKKIIFESRWWLLRIFSFPLLALKDVIADQITHPGCARVRTKDMQKKIYNEYMRSPEIVPRPWWYDPEDRDNLAQSPEVVKRPRYQKRPSSSYFYPNKPISNSHRLPEDVDGHVLDTGDGRSGHRIADEYGHTDATGLESYVVIGIFQKNSLDPYERLVRIGRDDKFFRVLHREIGKLRGWRRFVSLRSLSGFSLYRCDPKNFDSHHRIFLSHRNKKILQKLADAYKSDGNWYMKNSIGWNAWVCANLNGGRHDPTRPGKKGGYSLECLFGWSAKRITFAILTPLVLSLIFGIWYQQATGDVQTAWSIASYIVAAAALFVALLGVNGQLAGL